MRCDGEVVCSLRARSGNASDTRNFAGVALTARMGIDSYDRSEPPIVPGEALTLYFLTENEPGNYRTVDLRPPIAESGDPVTRGHRWVFDVARGGNSLSAAEAHLTFVGIESAPAELQLRLVDRALRRVVDLRAETELGFVSTVQQPVVRAEQARFELLAGTSDFVKGMLARDVRALLQTRLLPSFPNPMRSSATVRFEVARAGPVRLEVYDLSGRRLRALVSGAVEAGIHELAWDGRDDSGVDLAPGIYTLRMLTEDRGVARKVVKLP